MGNKMDYPSKTEKGDVLILISPVAIKKPKGWKRLGKKNRKS